MLVALLISPPFEDILQTTFPGSSVIPKWSPSWASMTEKGGLSLLPVFSKKVRKTLGLHVLQAVATFWVAPIGNKITVLFLADPNLRGNHRVPESRGGQAGKVGKVGHHSTGTVVVLADPLVV